MITSNLFLRNIVEGAILFGNYKIKMIHSQNLIIKLSILGSHCLRTGLIWNSGSDIVEGAVCNRKQQL